MSNELCRKCGRIIHNSSGYCDSHKPGRTSASIIVEELDKLTSEERADIFYLYCAHCGDKNPGCQCWNDE